jgi:hypothetical protein
LFVNKIFDISFAHYNNHLSAPSTAAATAATAPAGAPAAAPAKGAPAPPAQPVVSTTLNLPTTIEEWISLEFPVKFLELIKTS